MRQRTLGRTGIPVDAVTVGTSSLGRGTIAGSAGETAAVATALAFLAGPFAVIDTANEYAGGRSETVLGLARAAAASEPVARVFTKVDRDPETGRFDRDRVMRSFEESCERLGVDTVDVLHLHDPYSVTFSDAMSAGGAVEALRELRDAGRASAIGIAAGPIPLMTAYADTGAFDVLLSHNRFTLVDRSAQPLFELARARGMGVFNAAPFGAGVLATGARPGASYGYRPAGAELIAWVGRVERICADFGVSLQATALQFSLRSPLVDSTVVGVSSAHRLDELVELARTPVPDEVWPRIEEEGPAPTTIDDGEATA
ncbi:aldo/keto reductase [Microbacterium sp. Ru50]|uniref:aldo/keto reductase n=1 Tax=Microbacterium sp. Ru50 TaxID=2080744 RepID=UPI000CDD283F|nr:aldo/keto reductase [Microbacterium sp. Ru50]POX67924.1 aldo/keto reductase [Microbacterium sp. Ru50]